VVSPRLFRSSPRRPASRTPHPLILRVSFRASLRADRLSPIASPGLRPSPLRRHPLERPLPVRVAAHLRLLACPARSPVPSSWFRTTSAAFSALGLRACCIPLPTLGFAAFPVTPPVCRSSRGGRSVPRDAVHTPRRIPLAVSRAASPRSLPPCRSTRPPGRRTSIVRASWRTHPDALPGRCRLVRRRAGGQCSSGLRGSPCGAHCSPKESSASWPCSVGESVASRAVASLRRPILPWALFPFKVTSARNRPRGPLLVDLVDLDPSRGSHRQGLRSALDLRTRAKGPADEKTSSSSTD